MIPLPLRLLLVGVTTFTALVPLLTFLFSHAQVFGWSARCLCSGMTMLRTVTLR